MHIVFNDDLQAQPDVPKQADQRQDIGTATSGALSQILTVS
jgi:hypothetical protein